ncbi:MAG TPA: AAA family ATPase, partial [Catenuloplanes sp.]
MSLVSPVLVGRGTELRDLAATVSRARGGAGGATFVVGEAGIGKTRLAASVGAAASAAGVRVVRGRAAAVPLRAVSEAVFAAMRHETVDPERLGGFWPVLWRLVSDGSEQVADPPLVRAEAVLRLLAQTGRSAGCLLVLEDLHEADADTLHVVDYLVDNVAEQPVVLLATLRPDAGPVLDLANSAVARRAATLLRLTPLDRAETAELVTRCLGGDPPADLLDRLHRDAEGIPFVVEELLATMVDDGTLHRRGGTWQVAGDLRTRVPGTITAAVQQRVDRLPAGAAAVLRSAAVLGRSFALPTAAAVAGVAEDETLAYLGLAARAQLIGPEPGATADRYAFRHALTAEAILAGLQPAERARLSRTAAAVVEAADGQEQLAAELWARGDRGAHAAALYCRAGRWATNRGALATAAALLDRGLALAERSGDDELTAKLLAEQLHALGLAGHLARVFDLGERQDTLLSRLDAEPARRVAAHLVRARAAATAGDHERGLRQIAAARQLVDAEPDDVRRAAFTAPIDAVAAHLTYSLPGVAQTAQARRLAQAALAAAAWVELPEVACEALDVLSRCARREDLATAQGYAERALEMAERHDLPIWRLRAATDIATMEKDRTNDTGPLLAVRATALAAGAVIGVAWIDLHLALPTCTGATSRRPSAAWPRRPTRG